MTKEYCNQLKDFFIAECDNLKIAPELRRYLIKNAFGDSSFYTFLPLEIYSICGKREDGIKNVMQLSVYSYLYLAAILYFDKIVDNKSKKIEPREAATFLFEIKEYAIRGLSALFRDNPTFWNNFEDLKAKMFASSFQLGDYNQDEDSLIELLSEKSVLSHLYIVAMQILTNADVCWSDIKNAIDNFHKGFQLLDDYEDFIEDYQNNQLNYYSFLLKSHTECPKRKVEFIRKYLYVSGLFQNGLTKSLTYFKQAQALFSELGLIHLNLITTAEIQHVEAEINHIELLLNKAEKRSKLSRKLLINNNIHSSIGKSLSFLKSNIDNYLYEDFIPKNNSFAITTTCFVMAMLSEFYPEDEYLYNIVMMLDSRYKADSHFVDWNAESIGTLLMAKHLLNLNIPQSQINDWTNYKQKDGGFSRFKTKEQFAPFNYFRVSDCSGWLSSHKCVSAISFFIANKLGLSLLQKNLREYLVHNQNDDGSISSYWWNNSLYASSFAVLCGIDSGAISYIKKMQKDNGMWTADGKDSPFYTALGLKALMYAYQIKGEDNLLHSIQKGVKWLLGQQYEDGSWCSEYIFRIPSPQIHEPNKVKKWYHTSLGANLVLENYSRIYSTALIHNTLCAYDRFL